MSPRGTLVPCLACHYNGKLSHSEVGSLGVDLLTSHQLLEIPHNASSVDTYSFHPCDSPHPTGQQELATIIFSISVSCEHVKGMTNHGKQTLSFLVFVWVPKVTGCPSMSSGLETASLQGADPVIAHGQPRDQSCDLSRENPRHSGER